jgi:hypothetical protein
MTNVTEALKNCFMLKGSPNFNALKLVFESQLPILQVIELMHGFASINIPDFLNLVALENPILIISLLDGKKQNGFL